MPRACSVCSHSNSAEITKLLLAGDSQRAIAARFGLKQAACQRHRANCLRTSLKREKPASESPAPTRGDSNRFDTDDPKSLVATTARLVDEALDLLEHAKRGDDRRTALAALREARDGLALLMRVSGMLAPDGASTTIIDQRRQTLQILGKLTEEELRSLARGEPIAAENVLGSVNDNRTLTKAEKERIDA